VEMHLCQAGCACEAMSSDWFVLRAMGNVADKPYSKANPTFTDGTISTRKEEKQVEQRLAIGAHIVYDHSA
jgi:hypothetical protein